MLIYFSMIPDKTKTEAYDVRVMGELTRAINLVKTRLTDSGLFKCTLTDCFTKLRLKVATCIRDDKEKEQLELLQDALCAMFDELAQSIHLNQNEYTVSICGGETIDKLNIIKMCTGNVAGKVHCEPPPDGFYPIGPVVVFTPRDNKFDVEQLITAFSKLDCTHHLLGFPNDEPPGSNVMIFRIDDVSNELLVVVSLETKTFPRLHTEFKAMVDNLPASVIGVLKSIKLTLHDDILDHYDTLAIFDCITATYTIT